MIRIAFTASPRLLARLIRKMTHGRASHSFILYESQTWGGDWVAEATVGGVRMVPAEKSMHNVVAVYGCKFDASLALQKIRQHVGDGYDYAGLLFFGWAILMWRLFRVKVRRPWRSSSEEFCSEFVAMFLKACQDLELIPKQGALDPDPEKNNPEVLFSILEACPAHFERIT